MNFKNSRIRLVLALLLTVAILMLASCSKDDGRDAQYNEDYNNDSDYSSESTYDLETFEADRILDFVNGRAWIRNEANNKELICIDSNGKKQFSLMGDIVYASPFTDDTAFVVYLDDATYHSYGDLESAVYHETIVDENGDQLYTTQSESSETETFEEHIMAYGEGKYVVLRHESDIDNDNWTLGTIDAHGNTIDTFKSYDGIGKPYIPLWGDHLRGSYSDPFYLISMGPEKDVPCYIGDGYFQLPYDDSYESLSNLYPPSSIIYNPSKGTAIECNYSDINGEASNGYLLIDDILEDDTPAFYAMNLTSGQMESFKIQCPSSNYYDYRRDQDYSLTVSNGLIFYDHGYYDIFGNEKIHVQGYDDKDIFCTRFIDGYAELSLIGADGNEYITLIDSNGAPQFEPFRTDWYSYRTSNGCFFSAFGDEYAVYDHQGNKVRTIPLDVFNDSTNFMMSEGFLRVTQGIGSHRLFAIPQ